MSSPIIHSYILGKNPQRDPDEQTLVTALHDDRPTWVHLDANHPDTRGWLQANVSYLNKFILDALLAVETRPRLTEINDGSMLILRGVNLNEGADPEDMISVRIWVDKNRIITMRRRKLMAIQDIAAKLDDGNGPQTTGELVSQLAMRLFERMEPVILDLDDQTDDIEERVIESPSAKERNEIIDIRKTAILLRRYIAPQKEAINQMKHSDQSWLSADDKRHIFESADRVTRYVEDLDAIRERAQIVKDELANSLSDRLNKNLYILSVISAIFLPLGFFTGLMGINIGGMPGVDNNNAFWIFSSALVAMTFIQLVIFKLLRWI